MTLLIGADVGTSGLKAIAIDAETGRVIASASRDYPLSVPRAGWAEQDPSLFREALFGALAELSARLGPDRRRVASIGLTGQMHSAVLLDEANEPVRPAILWCDVRTTEECRAITEKLGHEGLHRATGNRALEGFTLPKLLWLRAHEPASMERARTLLMPKDYAGLLLTGERGADMSDASGTLMFDPRARTWSDAIVRAFDLPPSLLPPVDDSPTLIGALTERAASETGLAAGTLVARGAADNAAGAVGLGVVRDGRAMASIGTSGVVLAHADAFPEDPTAALHAFCHAVPNRWYAMGVMLAAGGALRWYRDTLCDGERMAAELRGEDAYSIITDTASTARRGSGGVVFLPYLMGERTPHNDASARAAFVGLTARTGKAEMSRAVLEGITYGLADSLDLIRGARGEVREVRLTGGGAKSRFWRQLMADVFDAPVAITTSTEGPAFGAAILAGVASGHYTSVEEGADALVHITSRVEPEPVTAAYYRDARRAYVALYTDLRARFAELGKLE